MYNRTLNRPMFRRGGRANGGIMDGVKRQGYDEGLTVVKDDPTKVEKTEDQIKFLKQAIGERPEIKPYPYKGSDFFMGLGANILAQPGGQPIFQTIGQAGINPLKTLAAQNLADYGNQQKNLLGKYEDNKDLIMSVYKNMSEEDKDAIINRAEQMVKAGRFETIEEALQVLVPTFRKDQSPQETMREEILRDEKINTSQIEDLAKIYEIGRTDAEVLNDFMNNISAGKYEGTYHDPDQYFIEDNDVGRGQGAEKRLAIRDYDPEKSEYKEGRVYIDFLTKIAYVKQGQFFIPYTDYISESISTD
jgi:hypothetical protein